MVKRSSDEDDFQDLGLLKSIYLRVGRSESLKGNSKDDFSYDCEQRFLCYLARLKIYMRDNEN